MTAAPNPAADPAPAPAPAAGPARQILRVTGADRSSFLQGLVSNDLRRLEAGPVYAALLSPQGKYLADFLLVAAADAILIDVAAPLAARLLQRLSLYRLRADVRIAADPLRPARGLSDPPAGALPDPRHPALGWRHYGGAADQPGIDWDAIRVAHVIPESGIELIPEETYILEAGFERLNGVDFRKGCYVGQEVTARMKHKTELRKGLVQVGISGTAPPGTPILTPEGREAGQLFTRSGDRALAHLRFDRMEGPLTAGDARIEARSGTPAETPPPETPPDGRA